MPNTKGFSLSYKVFEQRRICNSKQLEVPLQTFAHNMSPNQRSVQDTTTSRLLIISCAANRTRRSHQRTTQTESSF